MGTGKEGEERWERSGVEEMVLRELWAYLILQTVYIKLTYYHNPLYLAHGSNLILLEFNPFLPHNSMLCDEK